MALVIPAWQNKWIEVIHHKSGEKMLVKARYDPRSADITFVFEDDQRNFEIERITWNRWRLSEESRAKEAIDGQAQASDQKDH